MANKLSSEISKLNTILLSEIKNEVTSIFNNENLPFHDDHVESILEKFDYSLIVQAPKKAPKNKSGEPKPEKVKKTNVKRKFCSITSDCRHAINWIIMDIVNFINAHSTLKELNKAVDQELKEYDDEIENHSDFGFMSSFGPMIIYFESFNKNSNNEWTLDFDMNEEIETIVETCFNKFAIPRATKSKYVEGFSMLLTCLIRHVSPIVAQQNLLGKNFVLNQTVFEHFLMKYLPNIGVLRLSHYMVNRPKKVKKTPVQTKVVLEESSDGEMEFEDDHVDGLDRNGLEVDDPVDDPVDGDQVDKDQIFDHDEEIPKPILKRRSRSRVSFQKQDDVIDQDDHNGAEPKPESVEKTNDKTVMEPENKDITNDRDAHNNKAESNSVEHGNNDDDDGNDDDVDDDDASGSNSGSDEDHDQDFD